MQRHAPSFPAFEDWKKLSEREQDALLDRLEAAKRRGALAIRFLIGLACVAVVLATGLVLMTLG
jgi:hypothetical protein